jgi:hypothetical protein
VAVCILQAEAAERARADLRSAKEQLAAAAAENAAAAAAVEAAAARAAAAEADMQGLKGQLDGVKASHAAAAEEAAMLRANLDKVGLCLFVTGLSGFALGGGGGRLTSVQCRVQWDSQPCCSRSRSGHAESQS